MAKERRKRPTSRQRRLPYVLRVARARPPLMASIAFGVAVALLLWLDGQLAVMRRVLIAWDAGIALYLALFYAMTARESVAQIRLHAASQDEGRLGVLVLTVFAAVASLGAIVAELVTKQGAKPTGTQLALAAITIVLSWAFIHTIFAGHYAHDYYGEHGAKKSGLSFPAEDEPDYWDFVYFSFVIGTTCQVSDVAVESRLIRRTVAAHGVVSFLFNTALLALMVNIAASAI
jgi:uncharacterized membrane protein